VSATLSTPAIAANYLRPLIDATYPFEEAPEAYRHLKVVITIP
jgi:hypothetical protein